MRHSLTRASGSEHPSFDGRLVIALVVLVSRAMSHLSPYRLCAILRLARRGAQPASYEQAKAAREAVVMTSAHCQGDGCLPRSIAAALSCRLDGCWPTWCVGVLTTPLAAHAWIEAEGRIVEEPQGTDHFRVLLMVEPLRTADEHRSPPRGTLPWSSR